MSQKYMEYVIENFFVESFFERKEDDSACFLEETEPGGESKLCFRTLSEKSVVIRNVDKKNTQFLFFKQDKKHSLGKRVDHIVLEQREKEEWIAHLIEMKSGISCAEKWMEIKGKFRASYLLVQALCAILHMNLTEVRMYTVYENIVLDYTPENMVFRKPRVGEAPATPQMEWSGGKFYLRFGQDCQLPFLHTPIHVIRNKENILEGQFDVDH